MPFSGICASLQCFLCRGVCANVTAGTPVRYDWAWYAVPHDLHGGVGQVAHGSGDEHVDEQHTLVCLLPSPSRASLLRLIRRHKL